MSRRSTSTVITPLPATTSRRAAVAHLHDHLSMIDLNPLVQSRHHLMCPPAHAPADELGFTWYSITDRVVPGLPSPVSYTAAFRNTPRGLRTHVYAPMGLEIRGRWTVAGSLPGEEDEKEEEGPEPARDGVEVPRSGLYIREDIDLRCNVLVGGFVRKTLKKAHATLLGRIEAEARLGASRTPSPTSACRFLPDYEMFLGPHKEREPLFLDYDEHATCQGRGGAVPAPSAPLQPGEHMPTRAAKAARPPSFLQAPRPPSALRLSSAPSPSPTRIPRPTPDPKPSWPQAPLPPPASSPAPSLYPAPLRVRYRRRSSTVLSSYAATPLEPRSSPAWAPGALTSAPLPLSPRLAPRRPLSVVSKYPGAAQQDYSDIAAMNPFVDGPDTPDTPTSSSVSTSTYSSPATYFPPTYPSTRYSSNTDPDSSHDSSLATTPASDLSPGGLPRPDLCHSGRGLGIGIPGELLEETYTGRPWTEPRRLADNLPVSPQRPPMQWRLSRPACYELY